MESFSPQSFAARAEMEANDRALHEREQAGRPHSRRVYNEVLLNLERLMFIPGHVKWQKCQDIVGRMRLHGIPPDSMTYAVCMRVAGKCKLPLEVEELLSKMREDKILPTKVHFHAIMKAWIFAANMPETRRVLKRMAAEGVPREEVFSMLIASSCPDKAADIVLREIPEASLTPDRYTYNSWLHACVKAGDVQAALKAWAAFKSAGVQPSRITQATLRPFAALSDPAAQAICRECSELLASAVVSEPGSARVPREQSARPVVTTAESKVLEERRTSGEEVSSSDREPDSGIPKKGFRISAEVGGGRFSYPVEPRSKVVSEGNSKQTIPTASAPQKQGLDAGGLLRASAEAGVDATQVALKAWLSSTELESSSSKRAKQRTTWKSGSSSQPSRPSREAKPRSDSPPLRHNPPSREPHEKRVDWELSRRLESDAQPPVQSAGVSSLGQGFWRRLEELATGRPPATGGSQSLLDLHSHSPVGTRIEVYEKLEELARADAERKGLTIHIGKGRSGRLRRVVKDLLNSLRVPYVEGPVYGKLSIPSGAISEYVATQEKRRFKQRVVKSATIRYVGAGAIVFAAVSLVPVLLDRYAHEQGPD